MMRQIKASEVREGMEIEWSDRGWYHRGVVSTVERNDHVGVWVQSSDGFEMSVEPDQAFTVLAEPQPDEPTAFGACVEAAGERFVCTRPKHAYGWKKLGMGDSHIYSWYDITERGPVTVINPDPFATVQAEPEPRVWETWADVPEMTPVRVGDAYTQYRKVDGRIERKPGEVWVPAFVDEYDLNKYSPFTEVLDA